MKLRPKLRPLLRWLAMMDPVHMSADETDGTKKRHPAVFYVVESEWMSEELRTFLKQVDELYRDDWAHPSGRRRSQGNPPRTRLPSKKPANTTCVAPRGMPKNFYNRAWLKTLKPHRRHELMIAEDEVDLRMPSDLDVEEDPDSDMDDL